MAKSGKVSNGAMKSETAHGSVFLSRHWPWLVLGGIVLLTAAARVHTLNVPFERDEGEYAYAGQLLLHGVPPFAEAYNMKMPGIYVAYAVVMAVFGQTIWGVHLGLLVANGLTLALLFILGRRLHGPICGIATAAAYAALSISGGALGLFAHATHFLVLFAIAGLIVLLATIEKPRLTMCAASGLLFGVAFMMKQHAAPIILFAGLYLIWHLLQQRPVRWGRATATTGLFSLGVFLPFLLTCLWLYWAGVFDRFWLWTFEYARTYVSQVPFVYAGELFWRGFEPIWNTTWPIWILAALGITALAWDKASRRHAVFALGFFGASFLAICPGFYFRGHYFVTWLPATALLAGIFLAACAEKLSAKPRRWANATVIGVALIASGTTFFREREVLFAMPMDAVSRSFYSANPFPESLPIAQYIREHSTPDDRIAVIGSEPQICFYSHRRNATGYVYMYPLMEIQPNARAMQQEMIGQIETAKPKFVVYVSVSTSWLIQPQSTTDVLRWAQTYLEQHYALCGMADITGKDATRYVWGAEAENYRPRSAFWVALLQRKD